jgi:hypothetical protein
VDSGQIKTLLLSFYFLYTTNAATPRSSWGSGPLAKGGKIKAVSKDGNVASPRNNRIPDSPTYVSDYIDDKSSHLPANLEALDVESPDYFKAEKESRKKYKRKGARLDIYVYINRMKNEKWDIELAEPGKHKVVKTDGNEAKGILKSPQPGSKLVSKHS